ncbi:telomere binding protein [Polyrhizophydium stewartii]|uniref:Telomere binding protein n=1 Tax=Polyrhizophydium stewartii TaxID=2732419 RepID=A0ABR4N7A4_9FUNG
MRSLATAPDLASALQTLEELASERAASTPAHHARARATQALLVKDSSLKWVLCLTDAERERLFEAHYTLPCGSDEADPCLISAVETLLAALRASTAPAHRRFLAATLVSVVELHSVADFARRGPHLGRRIVAEARHLLAAKTDYSRMEWNEQCVAVILQDWLKRGHTDGVVQPISEFVREYGGSSGQPELWPQVLGRMQLHEACILLKSAVENIVESASTFGVFTSLVLATHYCSAERLQANENARLILTSIPHFLEVASLPARSLGLHFAELFSRRIHPQIKLDFGQQPHASVKDVIEALRPEKAAENASIVKAWAQSRPSALENPDVDATSSRLANRLLIEDDDDDDDEDDDDDDDDRGDRGNKEDESDASGDESQAIGFSGNQARRRNPHRKGFLSECLAALKTDDKPDQFETCLADLAGLVRVSTEIEIDEMHKEICSRLVSLQDLFDTPGFEELRMNAWVAILERRPKKTASHLAQALFDKDCTLSTKMWILRSWKSVLLDDLPAKQPLESVSIPSSQSRSSSVSMPSRGARAKAAEQVSLVAEFLLLALFDQLNLPRNWQMAFGRDDMFSFAREILSTIKLLALSAANSPNRLQLMEELALFLQGFENQPNRIMFMADLVDLAKIQALGAQMD